MTCSPASLPHKRQLKYNLAWGQMILERFWKSHTRVREFLVDDLGLQESWLAYLIACGDPDWPVIRSLGHIWDKWLDAPGFSRVKQASLAKSAVHLVEKSMSIGLLAYVQTQIDELCSKSR